MKKILDIIKTTWVVIWWLSVTMVVWLPILITGRFSSKGVISYKICQIWVWIGKTICFTRIKYRISDKVEAGKSYMIMSNHQSLLDIPALMLMNIPFRWVLKKEIGYVPFFGWALWGGRQILINRSRPKQALKEMNQAIKNLGAGTSVAIFPEGTRSETGELKDFKIGGFLSAINGKLPILPVTINGSHKIMPDKKSLSFFPGEIEVIVGDPIDTTDYTKREMVKLMEHTRSVIASKLVS